MKKSMIATIILCLVSGSVFATNNNQSNAQDYHPGATNNQERLGDIDPNYELIYPSEREGYTQYDNPYMSKNGTYTTYEKRNPGDEKHVADEGSLSITHAQGGVVMADYTTKNGENRFSVMCGYTSGPSYWADSKPGDVCKDAQALAVALEKKGQWKLNPMKYTTPPAKVPAS